MTDEEFRHLVRDYKALGELAMDVRGASAMVAKARRALGLEPEPARRQA